MRSHSTILFMDVALEARKFEILCSLRAVETLRRVSCYKDSTMKEDCILAFGHLCRYDYNTTACKKVADDMGNISLKKIVE
ncbi:hypothetical protein DY000_02043961 [Brassica cretica]|uniref:Uncharacterized protein n=1 Tax=Brassica cretica TaxID=69181 RepID=A0ABQ7BBC9_BRACR|nr:hypothetical protein DY000_02043961 [Brassica cretica]